MQWKLLNVLLLRMLIASAGIKLSFLKQKTVNCFWLANKDYEIGLFRRLMQNIFETKWENSKLEKNSRLILSAFSARFKALTAKPKIPLPSEILFFPLPHHHGGYPREK
jgi:hypothetical protein